MYLNGSAALALLARHRIPKVFGMTVGVESADPGQHGKVQESKTLRITIRIDRERAAPVLSLSIFDPVERHEQVAVDVLHGLHSYQVISLVNLLELPRNAWEPIVDAAQHLYRVLLASDALSISLDPLLMDANGRLVTLDSRIYLDDSANFRHPELAIGPPQEADDERLARMAGISYVRFSGQIGVIANGAGLALATMDAVRSAGKPYGMSPANFMDIGGSARSDTVETGLRILLNYHRLKSIIFNVFGGVTRVDEVAQGIISACDETNPPVPLVLRLYGTNAYTGRARLEQAGFSNLMFASSLMDTVNQALQAAKA